MKTKILKLKGKKSIKIVVDEVDRFWNSYNEYYAWTIDGYVIINKKKYDFTYDDENGNQSEFEEMFSEIEEEKLWRAIKSVGRKSFKKNV